MTEVVIYRHPEKALELVIDTDGIDYFESPRDVHAMDCAGAGCRAAELRPDGTLTCGSLHRVMGAAHLNITFKPGHAASWREVTENAT